MMVSEPLFRPDFGELSSSMSLRAEGSTDLAQTHPTARRWLMGVTVKKILKGA